jgi:hypothetical protein
LSTIKKSTSYDAEVSLSLQSDFIERETLAASVSVILDCCHAAAGVSRSEAGSAIPKDATTTAFDEAIQVVNEMDHRASSSGKTAFTFLLASDIAGKAYDIPIDIQDWENGVYADEVGSVALNFDAHFSRLTLALFQISRVGTVMERDASDIETLGTGNRVSLFLSACKARDVDLALTENDDGLITLGAAEAALAKAMENEMPKQSIKVVDPHEIAFRIPLFFRKSTSRTEKLDTIRKFADARKDIFTEKTRARIDDFLLTANRKNIEDRTEVQLDLESRLFEAATAGSTADFVEIFILRDYDVTLRSEVNAAVRRRLEKSDKVGMRLSQTIETKEKDIKDMKKAMETRNGEFVSERSKLDTRVWRWRIATLLVFVGMTIFCLIIFARNGINPLQAFV